MSHMSFSWRDGEGMRIYGVFHMWESGGLLNEEWIMFTAIPFNSRPFPPSIFLAQVVHVAKADRDKRGHIFQRSIQKILKDQQR